MMSSHPLHRSRLAAALLAAALATASPLATTARADGESSADTKKDAKDKKAVIEKKADPRVKFSYFVEAGITGNPNDPNDHQNFGRAFDDRANEPMLNQATITVERALVPVAGQFDFGFKLQAGVGSDGRYVNTLGTLENVNRGIVMPYIVEAYGNLHAPLSFLNKDAGVDLRFGQFVTLLGAETVDPRTNYFYSHDYIFNFGIPLQHLGVLSTIHFNPTLDVYAGITRGANTSIYDNNGYAAFLGGFGLNNLAGGKLTLLLTTSIGPENPREVSGSFAYNGSGIEHRSDLRYYNDLVATYKVTDKLTSIAEGVYTYDDGFDAELLRWRGNPRLHGQRRGDGRGAVRGGARQRRLLRGAVRPERRFHQHRARRHPAGQAHGGRWPEHVSGIDAGRTDQAAAGQVPDGAPRGARRLRDERTQPSLRRFVQAMVGDGGSGRDHRVLTSLASNQNYPPGVDAAMRPRWAFVFSRFDGLGLIRQSNQPCISEEQPVGVSGGEPEARVCRRLTKRLSM